MQVATSGLLAPTLTLYSRVWMDVLRGYFVVAVALVIITAAQTILLRYEKLRRALPVRLVRAAQGRFFNFVADFKKPRAHTILRSFPHET
jgi:hypothetical protein